MRHERTELLWIIDNINGIIAFRPNFSDYLFDYAVKSLRSV